MSSTTIKAAVTVDAVRHDRDGCVAYLAIDDATRTAIAIDPRLDQVDELFDRLVAHGAKLAYVMDTHGHADHLSGVRRLAERTGAAVLVHAVSKARFPARRVNDGDALELGRSTVRIVHVPGHTPDSVAVLVGEHVFTGDALFVGGAGRTDFPGGSASELYDSFRKLEALPDETHVHPGHDYERRGSSTIAAEKAANQLLREKDRAALVAKLDVKGPLPANVGEILRYNFAETDAATTLPSDVQGQFLLDVRSPLEFESERIEGAVNVPLEELERRLDELPASVVVVCRTGVRATIAAGTLARSGRSARVLEGGMLAWRKAGRPVKEGRKRLPVDRQVQLIVGLAVLSSVTLGAFVHPLFLGIAAFFGAGLTFAGASGTCGLALVLMRMPWNRLPEAPAAANACSVGGSTCAVGGK